MTPARAGSQSQVQFQRLDHPRAHEYVAEQLRREIALRLIPAGEALPPERELAKMFGVGRATVQQAIGLLDDEGLVDRRRGRTGGTFVIGSVRDDASKRRLLAGVTEQRRTIEEALAFRLEVEPAAAAQAALMCESADLRAVEGAASQAMEAPDDAIFMRHDTEFHLAIGRATHNRFFADSMERVRLVLNDALVVLPESPLWHDRSHRAHEALVAALTTGDAGAARATMLAHVTDTDRSVRALLSAL